MEPKQQDSARTKSRNDKVQPAWRSGHQAVPGKLARATNSCPFTWLH